MIGDENEDEPQRGDTSVRVLGVVVGLCLLCCIYPLGHLRAWDSAAPTELNPLLSVYTQGFISGFALIPPWAMQECRPKGFIARFCLCFPMVSFRALPSFHPGLCGSAALSGLIARFCLCVPRVPYRALPSFHPGLCGGVALKGFSLDWVFAVLRRGIVFVKCVWVCKWVVAFVRVFCICLIVIVWGVVLGGFVEIGGLIGAVGQ